MIKTATTRVPTLDPSALRLQIARRLVRETQAVEKLDLLARLQRRYVECRLPKESETRVEQSFNEQLFAKIFGYETLFSHDELPYHLRPKNYASGVRRYDDFSLGTFWGDDRDSVVATAEFKDAGTDLDAPQTDRRNKASPVEQAFAAAAGFTSCAWVIVSNFREIRLYSAEDSRTPLATFDLHEIRTARQLAALCAHFDREALLATTGTSDMASALDPKHPSTPIAAAKDTFRLICTFTPPPLATTIPLTLLYDALRETAAQLLKVTRDAFDDTPVIPTTLEDGWVAVETEKVRLAMSVEGQIRCSIRHPRTDGQAQINPDAGFWSVAHDLYDFLAIVERLSPGLAGIVSFELREIQGWQLYFNAKDLLRRDDKTNCGVADADDIFGGDVLWPGAQSRAATAAQCMGELAIQFKSSKGTRVRFDHAALALHFDDDKRRILTAILQEIARTGWFPNEHTLRTKLEADQKGINRLLNDGTVGRILRDGCLIVIDGLRAMKADPIASHELEICAALLDVLQTAYRKNPEEDVDLSQVVTELRPNHTDIDLKAVRRAAFCLQRIRYTAGLGITLRYDPDGMPSSMRAGDGVLTVSRANILG